MDWAERRAQFEAIVERARARSAAYDCVIPVSGGKDSHWQVAKCLEAGLRPLAVTWRPPARTALGQRNLDNLRALGVDHIDFAVSPTVERKFLVKAFERFGSTAVPMHLAIFSIPTTIAVRFGIPLVIWGEDSATEYVGRETGTWRLDAAWVRTYGAVQGTSADDWADETLSEAELTPYRAPSDEELARHGVEALFLGYFFRWDPEETARVAAEHGFESAERPKTGYYASADIDDDFISLHHFLKWHKFGFTRSWDNLSLEIRNGRMTRAEAIATLAEIGDETPHADIRKFCEYVGWPVERFFEVCERFRNTDVWTKRHDGTWVIEDFLVPDWDW